MENLRNKLIFIEGNILLPLDGKRILGVVESESLVVYAMKNIASLEFQLKSGNFFRAYYKHIQIHFWL